MAREAAALLRAARRGLIPLFFVRSNGERARRPSFFSSAAHTHTMLRHLVVVLPICLGASSPAQALSWPLWRWADESCDGSVVKLSIPATPPLFGAPSFLGPPLTPAGLHGRLARADPLDACAALQPLPEGAIVVTSRGGCAFEAKARAVADAGGANASAAALAALPPTVSTDAATGAGLLAAADAGAEATLSLPDLSGPDPGAALLALLALAGVSLGARAAARDEVGSTSEAEEEEEEGLLVSVGEHAAPPPALDGRAALALVGGMAGVLIVAWALPSLAGWVLSAGFLVGSSDAAWRAVFGCLRRVLPRPAARACSTAVLTLTAAAWLARGPRGVWPLHDALGLALAASAPRALRLASLSSAVALLACAALNDLWWVFVQPAVTGGPSVMVAVASATPALVFLAPLLKGGPHAGVGLLGLGDVVIPGLAVAAVARWEARAGRGGGWFNRWRCSAACVGGYGVGLLLTYAALIAGVGGGAGQPALIYLSPCVGGAAVCAAAAGGELRAQWNGGEGEEVQEGEVGA